MYKFIISLITVLFSSSVFAQSPQMIDFSKDIVGPDGPFKECKQTDQSGKCIDSINLTLGRICITAAGLPDKDANIVDQVKHGKLASELITSDKLSLSVEDIAFLKKQIAKLGYNTIIVYQAVKLLDPASVDK